ncbi:MAG: vWA domain-containing protein [Phototrophicaceae bacterium]
MFFLTPWGFLAASLTIPILLLYMLRLRREEVLVSSTFLWQQVLQDASANTPWQRLRRNLLLLLQLLILALLVFALARPFVMVPSLTRGHGVVLLDASASMSATDLDGGQSRFEGAKARALELIQNLGTQDRMTIIRVAGVPQVLISQSSDRAALREAIQNAQGSVESADWNAALTLAIGSVAGSETFSWVIIGDGGLGEIRNLPALTGKMEYLPVGRFNDNVGITALATRTQADAAPQLFAELTNFGDAPAEVVFDLQVDGAFFTAERYTLAPQATLPLTSANLPNSYATIRAALTPVSSSTTPDYLLADNVAYAVQEPSPMLEALLMSEGNLFLDRVLSSLPTVQHLTISPTQPLPRRPFDLYIFDGVTPTTLPNADMLIINPPSTTPLYTVGERVEQPFVLQTVPNDPLTAFVDFDRVNLQAYRQVQADWAKPLITANDAPIFMAGEINGQQVALLNFDLGESDLPLQITFPILMQNLLGWYRPSSTLLERNTLILGETAPITLVGDGERVRVTRPDGTQDVQPITQSEWLYPHTNQVGVYQVDILQGEAVLQSANFAVNLFDAHEQNIAPQAQLRLGQQPVEIAQPNEQGQREVWTWFGALAWVLLMVEWWIDHRRRGLLADRARVKA